jgi:hypothetical protein
MSLIKANAVQIGQSGTATQNFTLAVPSSPDGTIKLARGNSGATTQDVMNVSNTGVVSFPQGFATSSITANVTGNLTGDVFASNGTSKILENGTNGTDATFTGSVLGGTLSGNASSATALATGSITSRLLANRFADVVNAKDFGAIGDGASHPLSSVYSTLSAAIAVYPFVTSLTQEIDWAAIQSSLKYILSSGRRSTVLLPPGTYYISDTITIEGLSCGLIGEEGGELATVLYINHSNGPGVHIKNRRNFLKNVDVKASPSRLAGVAGTNYGVLMQPNDIQFQRCTNCVINNVIIQEHPNHGLLVVGACWFSEFKRLTVINNLGHGIAFDNGESFSRTWKENPGIVEIENVEVNLNSGHGLIIGNDNSVSNRGFRFNIRNLDLYGNAESSGVRKEASQMWMFGDTSNIQCCAFDGFNKAKTVITTQGIWVYGQSISISECRFLSVKDTAVTVGGSIFAFNTSDIKISNNRVIDADNTNPPLDPAVAVSSQATNIDVNWGNISEIGNPKTLTNNSSSIATTNVIYKNTTQIVNNTTTLTSDDELEYSLLAKQRAFFRFHIFFTSATTADIKFAINAPVGSTIQYAPTQSVRITGSDTLTVQPMLGNGGTFSVGAGGLTTADARLCEIAGIVETNGTAGLLDLKWAQGIAEVSDTSVLLGSYLEIKT